MQLLNPLFVFVLLILIISYAIGLIMGGPARANKILSWELKKLTQFGRWLLKNLFQVLANVFQYLANLCGAKKKKRTT
ncbi:MAG: hypothetical protein V4697_02740 [Patescibacteria group bacterium]